MNNYINKNQLLPGSILYDIEPVTGQVTDQFMPSDSRELFEINRKKFPEKNLENFNISYNLNSNGYRAPEWDTVDWKNSIVIFGCSIVFGIGLPKEETISYKLEKLLNQPVINLGVPGSGPTYTLHNSQLIFKNFGIPKIVISLWSSFDRIHIYNKDNIKLYGSWSDTSKKEFYHHWGIESEINAETHNHFSVLACKDFWESKTIYLEGSLFKDTADRLNYKMIKQIDCGRDLMHPGPTTANIIAKTFYRQIKNSHR
jgi:hypothetical protein